MLTEAKEKLVNVKDNQEQLNHQNQVEEILALPFTCTLYLDGDVRRDFVNFQAGRTLDASHMFSLRVQEQINVDPDFRTAFELAKLLHEESESPFHNLIRFDSRGSSPL